MSDEPRCLGGKCSVCKNDWDLENDCCERCDLKAEVERLTKRVEFLQKERDVQHNSAMQHMEAGKCGQRRLEQEREMHQAEVERLRAELDRFRNPPTRDRADITIDEVLGDE